MRLENLQKELNKIEQRRATLQAQISKESAALYTSLPKKLGLKSVDSLVEALLPYASQNFRAKLGTRPTPAAKGAASAGTGVKKRHEAKASGATKSSTSQRKVQQKHSEAVKSAVKQDFQRGVPGKEIAAKHGVNFFTLKKWKRKWGMTKATKSKAK